MASLQQPMNVETKANLCCDASNTALLIELGCGVRRLTGCVEGIDHGEKLPSDLDRSESGAE